MRTELINPLITGMAPDPSVVRVGSDFYIVTSSFEYLPGLPVYRSSDFRTWHHIGNVAVQEEQLGIRDAPTLTGVYAPTIRHHDGLFHVIVTVVGGRGCLVFTAADPAGEWSDGMVLAGLHGIDPDLAWDDDGTCYVTYSGIVDDNGRPRPSILQVRVDLTTGTVLEDPRPLWSGTGPQGSRGTAPLPSR